MPVFYEIPTLKAQSIVSREATFAVTGSRISRTDVEISNPVTIVTPDFIAKSGYTTVQKILSMQPAAAGMSLGSTSNNSSSGSATLNLRGMRIERALVLLNGRRIVASGTEGDAYKTDEVIYHNL